MNYSLRKCAGLSGRFISTIATRQFWLFDDLNIISEFWQWTSAGWMEPIFRESKGEKWKEIVLEINLNLTMSLLRSQPYVAAAAPKGFVIVRTRYPYSESSWEVRQNQVSSRSFYTQLIPGRGAWADLP
jgi:hypothetical protein